KRSRCSPHCAEVDSCSRHRRRSRRAQRLRTSPPGADAHRAADNAMRAWPSSLRSHLTFWYAALLALPLVAFALLCYFVFERAPLNRTDRFIGDALSAFSRELSAERRSAGSVEAAMQTTVDEVRFRDLEIVILDSTRRGVALTGSPDAATVAPGGA